jgi:hypothetical protein
MTDHWPFITDHYPSEIAINSNFWYKEANPKHRHRPAALKSKGLQRRMGQLPGGYFGKDKKTVVRVDPLINNNMEKIKEILFTFTGFHDPYSKGLIDQEDQPGPILSLLSTRAFDHIYLFDTPSTYKITQETVRATYS